MGLSDHERIDKFYSALRGWRHSLIKLRDQIPDEHRPRVDDWVKRVDRLTGIQIRRSDATSIYWLLGQNEDGYRGLHSNPYGLSHLNTPRKEKRRDVEDVDYWIDEFTLDYVAEKWTESNFCKADEVRALAAWWVMWDWIPAIYYPLYRYDDKVFDPILSEEMTILVGEMANLRYEIVSKKWLNLTIDAKEQALLCKFNLLHALLREESNKQFRKTMAARDRAEKCAKKAGRKYVMPENLPKTKFDGHGLLEKVGQMNLLDVEKQLDSLREKQDKNSYKDPPHKDKPDGILGPVQRSEEELDRILETSMNLAECEAANAEREKVYSAYWGGWKDRFKKPTKKPQRKQRARG